MRHGNARGASLVPRRSRKGHEWEINHVGVRLAILDGIGEEPLPEINESLGVERDGHLVALVHFNDNVLDWNYENQDRFLADLEKRKQDILEFVNSHVNRSSRIKEVEVEKQPFAKTATMKIKRFLYKEKKNEGTDK